MLRNGLPAAGVPRAPGPPPGAPPAAAAGAGPAVARRIAGAAVEAAVVDAAFHRPAPSGSTGAAGAVEHRQFALEAGQHDFGRIALLALLIGPFAGLQLALDIDLRTLAQVF